MVKPSKNEGPLTMKCSSKNDVRSLGFGVPCSTLQPTASGSEFSHFSLEKNPADLLHLYWSMFIEFHRFRRYLDSRLYKSTFIDGYSKSPWILMKFTGKLAKCTACCPAGRFRWDHERRFDPDVPGSGVPEAILLLCLPGNGVVPSCKIPLISPRWKHVYIYVYIYNGV